MGSTNTFPSGLSDWLEDDRPERLDFVGDNRILDEDAMWKATYDEDGLVADAGGIVDYVQAQSNIGDMAKVDYDPDDTVGAVGIPAFVDTKVQEGMQSALDAAGAAQTTAGNAMPKAGGAFTGAVTAAPGAVNKTVRNVFTNTAASWPAGYTAGDILLVYS